MVVTEDQPDRHSRGFIYGPLEMTAQQRVKVF